MSEESGGEKVPIWIISFADMITLLLSFFVMLQTMSKSRDATLFGISQDSFRRAIAGLGMPDVFLGKQTYPQFNYRKLKYPTEEADATVPPNRIIDADDELIRKLFQEISSQSAVRTSNNSSRMLQVHALGLKFDPQGQLEPAGAETLGRVAANLRQELADQQVTLTATVLVKDDLPAREQWKLSARRADAVGRCLTDALAQAKNWTVRSWGGGAAQEPLQSVGRLDEKTNVVITISTTRSTHGG